MEGKIGQINRKETGSKRSAEGNRKEEPSACLFLAAEGNRNLKMAAGGGQQMAGDSDRSIVQVNQVKRYSKDK